MQNGHGGGVRLNHQPGYPAPLIFFIGRHNGHRNRPVGGDSEVWNQLTRQPRCNSGWNSGVPLGLGVKYMEIMSENSGIFF